MEMTPPLDHLVVDGRGRGSDVGGVGGLGKSEINATDSEYSDEICK
jgi:hypothetical protein